MQMRIRCKVRIRMIDCIVSSLKLNSLMWCLGVEGTPKLLFPRLRAALPASSLWPVIQHCSFLRSRCSPLVAEPVLHALLCQRVANITDTANALAPCPSSISFSAFRSPSRIPAFEFHILSIAPPLVSPTSRRGEDRPLPPTYIYTNPTFLT